MKALVLSGGGVKGAFTTGVINHLLGDLNIQYDVYCGVSVGAINAAFLAQYPIGQEEKASQDLFNLWDVLETKDIYKNWLIPYWSAIWKTSIYDSSPLQNLIHDKIKLENIRDARREVNVGAVSISSGKYITFDQSSDDFIEAVLASASFPGMLCPIRINNQLWSDGGLKQITPVKVAIDAGANEIDIIMTSPEIRDINFIEHPTTIDIIKRSLDLSADKIMSNDIDKLLMFNQLAMAGVLDKRVIKLNIIRPKFNLIDDLLDFDNIKIQKMMAIGYLEAQRQYNNLTY